MSSAQRERLNVSQIGYISDFNVSARNDFLGTKLLKSSFEAVREFIENVREFIESSFKTLSGKNKGLFVRLTFDTSEYFFTGGSILISGQ